MKIFLSWSGKESQEVATAFRNWLPLVMQFTEPFMSNEDMKKGEPWSEELRNQLMNSRVGIIFVTEENRRAEWLAFEAGALLNGMGPGSVCPFLFNVDPSDIDGPLRQFQSTTFSRADIKRLLDTLNEHADESERLRGDMLEGAFDHLYRGLESKLKRLEKGAGSGDDQRESVHHQALPGDADVPSNVGAIPRELAEPDHQVNHLRSTTVTSPNDRTHVLSPANRLARLKELQRLLPKLSHKYILLYLAIDLFRDDLPWIYDAGVHLVGTLRIPLDWGTVESAASAFMELVEATFENRTMTELYNTEYEHRAVGTLRQIVKAIVESSEYRNSSICRRHRVKST